MLYILTVESIFFSFFSLFVLFCFCFDNCFELIILDYFILFLCVAFVVGFKHDCFMNLKAVSVSATFIFLH